LKPIFCLRTVVKLR